MKKVALFIRGHPRRKTCPFRPSFKNLAGLKTYIGDKQPDVNREEYQILATSPEVYRVAEKWSAFEQYVRQVMEEQHIAGMAAALAVDGELIYAKSFGYRDLEGGAAVTPDTIFGLASVSKSFTAMAITRLADAGKVDVDAPVNTYLPDFRLRGAADMSAIKVRHLLSHTTGLPPMKRRPDIKTFDEHIAYLAVADYQLLGAPGEYFSYCNDTFLLLGAIIERVTGMAYRDHMTQMIRSIGMPRTTYFIDDFEALGNVTDLFVYDRKTGKHEKRPWFELGTYAPGGGVRSTVRDLLDYGAVYVNGGSFGRCRITSGDGLRRMYQPVYQTGRRSHYGFALQTTPDYAGTGLTLVEHGGNQIGVASNFGFIPEKGLVAVVLTNTSGAPANPLWLALVNAGLGLPITQKRSVEPDFSATGGQLERFVGTYRSAEGGRLKVALAASGASLQVEVEGEPEPLPARASDERTVVFHAGGQERIARFYPEGDGGRFWAVFFGMRMLRLTPPEETPQTKAL